MSPNTGAAAHAGDMIIVDTAVSTNTLMADTLADAPHGTALLAREQTAGRGQRGNSWESEAGKNVSLSVLLRPRCVKAPQQFGLSEAAALAVVEALDEVLDPATPAMIKWPNDIYVGDGKIAGMLIENSLDGTAITRSIAGIGVNLNQDQFRSDAPNPVSVKMLTGRDTDVVAFARRLTERLLANIDEIERLSDPTALHARYISRLWRGKGRHAYRDMASGERFMASVDAIAPTGHITLLTDDGERRTYAFKEVGVVLGGGRRAGGEKPL